MKGARTVGKKGEESAEEESQDGQSGEISGCPAQGFWPGLRQSAKLMAKQVGYSWEAATKCEVQEVWLILELRPKTLALRTACLEEGWIQAATAGQILSLPERNITLMTFSTFVHSIKISLEYL